MHLLDLCRPELHACRGRCRGAGAGVASIAAAACRRLHVPLHEDRQQLGADGCGGHWRKEEEEQQGSRGVEACCTPADSTRGVALSDPPLAAAAAVSPPTCQVPLQLVAVAIDDRVHAAHAGTAQPAAAAKGGVRRLPLASSAARVGQPARPAHRPRPLTSAGAAPAGRPAGAGGPRCRLPPRAAGSQTLRWRAGHLLGRRGGPARAPECARPEEGEREEEESGAFRGADQPLPLHSHGSRCAQCGLPRRARLRLPAKPAHPPLRLARVEHAAAAVECHGGAVAVGGGRAAGAGVAARVPLDLVEPAALVPAGGAAGALGEGEQLGVGGALHGWVLGRPGSLWQGCTAAGAAQRTSEPSQLLPCMPRFLPPAHPHGGRQAF